MPELILDYAKKPPMLHSRIARRVFWIIVLGVVAFYGRRFALDVFHRFKVQAARVAQQNWEAAFTLPATQIMASDDPADVQALGSHQSYFQTHWRMLASNGEGPRPHPAVVYRMSYPIPTFRFIGGLNGFTIYTHERLTPGSESLIVYLDGEYDCYSPTPKVVLNARCSARVSWWPYGKRPSLSRPTSCLIPLQRGDHIRFFAGQSDPANPARFTFRYQINDQTFDMQGVLDDNGAIQLSSVKTPPTAPQ